MRTKIFHLLLLSYLTIASSKTMLHEPLKGYPERLSLKGIQPDFQDPQQIIGNAIHGVAFNFVWEQWQPTKQTECTAGQVKYDGYCYTIQQAHVDAIKLYTSNKIVVTGVLYGVPAWARRQCPVEKTSGAIFCAPTEEGSKDYGRFVGFIAWYFNGANGNGRVADFVIHNEVNASEWFNYGCTKGTCDVDTWTTIYSQSWNAAYDYVKKEQADGKVLISFEHNFDSSLDKMLQNDRPVMSVETFLKNLVPKLGDRKWRLAYHCYPSNLLDPTISADDYPIITFGNIGILAGWLRKNYPNNPEAWEIQLTENGFNGANLELYRSQDKYLCFGIQNILGTPGIQSLIYHRLRDNPDELKSGLGLGLWAADGAQKPAWKTYALCNQKVSGGNRCGFENLPYVKLTRAFDGLFHWVSTRMLPRGFFPEQTYKILREPENDTEIVYECRVGGDKGKKALISKDPNCEGHFNMGPLGYVWKSSSKDRVPLFRCYDSKYQDYFVSTYPECEGKVQEQLVGYVIWN